MTIQNLKALALSNQASYLLALTTADLDNGKRTPQTIAFILALIAKHVGV